jgi:SAM-dependent methyltransferase
MSRDDERCTVKRFAERYRVAQTEVTRLIELAVIGGDWGANGYTTVAQADLLGSELGLGSGGRLLDLGAGRGWPGLYLAATIGCRVVLADVPIEGLLTGVARARRERLADRAVAVASSARHLPFRSAAFDAVVHTDVLC